MEKVPRKILVCVVRGGTAKASGVALIVQRNKKYKGL